MDKGKKLWAALLCLLLGALALPSFALELGEKGDHVVRLQQVLYTRGYTQQLPDGWYGEKTRQAEEALFRYAKGTGVNVAREELAQACMDGRVPLPLIRGDEQGESENVLLAQRRLRALGYLADKADGQFGNNTRRAIMVFQWEKGLPLTGLVDEQTAKALYALEGVPAALPILAKGMKGDEVLALQDRLWQLGFFTGDLDGQYGNQTVEGIKALARYVEESGRFSMDRALLEGASGQADGFLRHLLAADFPLPIPMKEGDEGQEVYRLQRRLMALGYLTEEADGGYGKNTAAGVAAFQQQAGLKKTGQGDEKTLEKLFSSSAPEKIRPYRLVISLKDQALYVYDGKGKLRHTMDCTIGDQVVPGSWRESTRPDEKWAQLPDGSWAAWRYRMDENTYIQSVPYNEKEGQVDTGALMALGRAGKGSCIWLSPENARLIYEKCLFRTPIEIVQ